MRDYNNFDPELQVQCQLLPSILYCFIHPVGFAAVDIPDGLGVSVKNYHRCCHWQCWSISIKTLVLLEIPVHRTQKDN
jgi:hypothetical protein